MPSPTTYAIDWVKEFTSMVEALDFIDYLKAKKKTRGILNTKFTVTYTEPTIEGLQRQVPKKKGKTNV